MTRPEAAQGELISFAELSAKYGACLLHDRKAGGEMTFHFVGCIVVAQDVGGTGSNLRITAILR